ncbi:hypothetical protein HDF24_00260 [Mucilaginibacter sp. X4EP1]|uniref:hypothetical protein n=1 Tax=Mucilaginibacter sp. X4EP1 TaxID=2723092 RepID=UPI002169BEEE|nr:hypothetical protein [Mucilaginibacter sp. X4EP1]
MFVMIMDENTNLVWYASYGSNINKERFLCYIRGGQPNGAAKEYAGCSDPTLPSGDEELYINSQLYFAKSSGNWNNCGVGFLSNNFDRKTQTWGRMYLITKQQFVQVFEQETHRKNVVIDFERAITEAYTFAPGSWYGRIIYLGEQGGNPIFTFTNEDELTPTKPSSDYLKTIAAGIKECYPYSNEDIASYFINKPGIKDIYSPEEITAILAVLD